MKSILDPTFQYIPAANTDLRKTFARLRREMRKAEGADQPAEPRKVVPINPKQQRAEEV